jgi:hypothetical protein
MQLHNVLYEPWIIIIILSMHVRETAKPFTRILDGQWHVDGELP